MFPKYTYDEICVENFKFNLRAGEVNFLREIEKHFPEEINNVKEYLQDVKKTAKHELFFPRFR